MATARPAGRPFMVPRITAQDAGYGLHWPWPTKTVDTPGRGSYAPLAPIVQTTPTPGRRRGSHDSDRLLSVRRPGSRHRRAFRIGRAEHARGAGHRPRRVGPAAQDVLRRAVRAAGRLPL